MATLNAQQYEFIKKIEKGIQNCLIPETEMHRDITLLTITEHTSPNEISELYTDIMNRMMSLSNAILHLRSISAGLRGQMNIASAQGN